VHSSYKADVAQSKEVGDYYRNLSLNYRFYDKWNTTPVLLRDWDNPMYWPTHPRPGMMGYLERYFDQNAQQTKGVFVNDALSKT
jgi:hypothetical protein